MRDIHHSTTAGNVLHWMGHVLSLRHQPYFAACKMNHAGRVGAGTESAAANSLEWVFHGTSVHVTLVQGEPLIACPSG
jgi:hypothetical protein